jgi:hypothetical protein
MQQLQHMVKNRYRIRMVVDNMPVTTLDLYQVCASFCDWVCCSA